MLFEPPAIHMYHDKIHVVRIRFRGTIHRPRRISGEFTLFVNIQIWISTMEIKCHLSDIQGTSCQLFHGNIRPRNSIELDPILPIAERRYLNQNPLRTALSMKLGFSFVKKWHHRRPLRHMIRSIEVQFRWDLQMRR
jgi:hypothetical protein